MSISIDHLVAYGLSIGTDIGEPWMTLNGVIAYILRYFTEFDSFGGWLRHSGWR